MKSQRRHELEHNDLLVWLDQTIRKIQPYSKAIVLGALLVVLALVLGNWWRQYSSKGSDSAWTEFNAALNSRNLVELENNAQADSDSSVGQWAALTAANDRLVDGTQTITAKRADAIQELNKAIAMYDLVLEHSREDALRERALYGRAQAYESLAGTRQREGALDKAIADYQKLVETYPKSALAESARNRLADLNSKEIRQFYDKFAEYTPPARDAKPLPDLPGLKFEDSLLPEGGLEKAPKAPAGDAKPAAQDLSKKAEAGKTEPAKVSADKPESPAKPETSPKPETPAKPEAKDAAPVEKAAK